MLGWIFKINGWCLWGRAQGLGISSLRLLSAADMNCWFELQFSCPTKDQLSCRLPFIGCPLQEGFNVFSAEPLLKTVCLAALSHLYSESAVLKRALSIMKKVRAKRIFTPLNLDTKDLSVDKGRARAFSIIDYMWNPNVNIRWTTVPKIRFPPLYFYKFMDTSPLSVYKVRNIGSPSLEFQRRQSEHLLRLSEPSAFHFNLHC